MKSILINIDVPDLKKGIVFYTQAFDLKIGRKFGDAGVELMGLPAPIYLLEKAEGTLPFPDATEGRSYKRHWSPVHLDFVVMDIENTRESLLSLGAIEEDAVKIKKWGKIAMFRDPFGHGICLIEFLGRGYDEIIN